MKRIHKALILTLLMVVVPTGRTLAQSVTISASAAEGKAMKVNASANRYMNEGTSMQYYGVEATWHANGSTDSINVYDGLWGRPEVGGGFLLADFSHIPLHAITAQENPTYTSTIGQMLTFYATFRRDLLRTRHWNLGYKMENGVGICTKPYDLETNLQNTIIGSPLTVYFGLGLHVQYRPSPRWVIGVEGGFRHYSNGRLTQPNAGINTLDAGIRVGYTLQPDTVTYSPYHRKKDTTWHPHLYADFNVSWSPQTIYGEFQADFNGPVDKRAKHYKLYSGVNLRGALMYHYSRKFASGIALDYTYVPYVDKFREADIACGHGGDDKYNRNVLGIGIAHEAFWKNFSVAVSVGYYLFRQQGYTETAFEKPYFETAGLRYYLPRNLHRLYVGYNIKASAFHASGMQFGVGFCPWK